MLFLNKPDNNDREIQTMSSAFSSSPRVIRIYFYSGLKLNFCVCHKFQMKPSERLEEGYKQNTILIWSISNLKLLFVFNLIFWETGWSD